MNIFSYISKNMPRKLIINILFTECYVNLFIGVERCDWLSFDYVCLAGSMLQIIQQLSGINTFMYYSGSILQSSGIGDASTVIWLAAVPAAANFIFTFVGMWAVEQVR